MEVREEKELWKDRNWMQDFTASGRCMVHLLKFPILIGDGRHHTVGLLRVRVALGTISRPSVHAVVSEAASVDMPVDNGG